MRALLLLWFFALSAFAETGAERLARLDAVLQQAGTLDNLLARPDLLNAYYDRLAELYGREKFRWEPFDAIMGQLRDLKDKVPGLKEALWTPVDPSEAYSIQPETEISGRYLEPNLWKAFHQERLKQLRREAAELGPRANWEAQVQRIVSELKEARQRADESAQGKQAKGHAMAQYMIGVQNNPKAKALAAALVLLQTEKPETAEALSTSTDADILLTHLEDLRVAIGNEKLGLPELPKEITKMVEARTLNRKHMMEEHSDILPVEIRRGRFNPSIIVGTVGKGKIEFIPVHPMHAIFKGISIQECNAGLCLPAIDPQRWANSAFPGARLFYTFQEGSYHGFVQRIPIQDEAGNVYANHDFGSTILRNKTLVKRNGKWHVSNLFDLWAETVEPKLPAGWKGLAQSQNEMGDHADIRKTLLGSTAWQRSLPLGPSKNFQTLNPGFIRDLAAASPKPGDRTPFGIFPDFFYYGGDGVFDAAVHKHAVSLSLLQPNGEGRPTQYVGPDWGIAPRPPLPAPLAMHEAVADPDPETPREPAGSNYLTTVCNRLRRAVGLWF